MEKITKHVKVETLYHEDAFITLEDFKEKLNNVINEQLFVYVSENGLHLYRIEEESEEELNRRIEEDEDERKNNNKHLKAMKKQKKLKDAIERDLKISEEIKDLVSRGYRVTKTNP